MVTITATTRIVEFGDSITAAFTWPHVTGGLFDQINAKFTQPPATSANIGVATGSTFPSLVHVTGSLGIAAQVPNVPKSAQTSMQIGLTANSGWTSLDLFSHLPSALAQFPPDVALLHIGINDCINGGNMPAGSMANIFDTIHAAAPSCQIICLNVMAHFEQWDTGTGWGPNPDDTAIAAANVQIATAAATRPYVTVIDIRGPLLAAEQANNTSPVVGSVVGVTQGIYTVDGVHPLTVLKLLMAQQAMAAIQVVP